MSEIEQTWSLSDAMSMHRTLKRKEEEDKEVDRARSRQRIAVKTEYAELERDLFSADSEEERARITELLPVVRAQLADDSAANDRARFGGQRTLSLDAFSDTGYEPQSLVALPPRTVREEQEALEIGMGPFLSALAMDERDSLGMLYRYGFTYRDAAHRLGITTPALQRRRKNALDALRTLLLDAAGVGEEAAA